MQTTPKDAGSEIEESDEKEEKKSKVEQGVLKGSAAKWVGEKDGSMSARGGSNRWELSIKWL